MPNIELKRLGLVPKAVLDIGARNGESVVRFRALWPEAKIISFEPRPSAVKVLRAAAEKDGNCEVRAYGLGRQAGRLKINEFPQADGSSSLLKPSDTLKASRAWAKRVRSYEVEVKCLDEVGPFELYRPYFIKVDVQGYEAEVIRGGAWTFSRASACLVEVSHEELYQGGATFREIHALMDSMGMRYLGATRLVKRGDEILSWGDHLWVSGR